MSKPVYQWRQGASIAEADETRHGLTAQQIGEALEQVERKAKTLTADHLVADVESNKQHPLRPFFTWDTRAGMHKLHMLEGKLLIRCVYIVDKDTQAPARAWVSTVRDEEDEESQGLVYVIREKVAGEPELATQYLAQLRNSRAAFTREIENFTELVGRKHGKASGVYRKLVSARRKLENAHGQYEEMATKAIA